MWHNCFCLLLRLRKGLAGSLHAKDRLSFFLLFSKLQDRSLTSTTSQTWLLNSTSYILSEDLNLTLSPHAQHPMQSLHHKPMSAWLLGLSLSTYFQWKNAYFHTNIFHFIFCSRTFSCPSLQESTGQIMLKLNNTRIFMRARKIEWHKQQMLTWEKGRQLGWTLTKKVLVGEKKLQVTWR